MSTLGLSVLIIAITKTFYLEMGNVTYKQYHWTENVSRYVLSVGRSVVQVFFPITISTDYYQGSILNIAGIPFLIIGLYVLFKGKNRNDSLLWIGLAVLSHILTYIAFINDTYLYLPLVCVLISVNFYFINNPLPINKITSSCIVLFCFGLLVTKTLNASQMWRSDKELWQFSYLNEGSPHSSLLLGSYLLKHDEKLALELIEWGAKNYSLSGNRIAYIFFLETINESNLPIQKKIQIYSDCFVDHDANKAFFASALLKGTNDQMIRGVEMLNPILKKISKQKELVSYLPKILKEIKIDCTNDKAKSWTCQELNLTY
jgi:membrane-bound metal-dependent hydrolase YbcI (DUF457 family)